MRGRALHRTDKEARHHADARDQPSGHRCAADPKVALGFSSEAGVFSDGIYVAVEGTAELIRDKAAFQQHWTTELDEWFDKGIDTPGIVLIKVKAKRATYWRGREEGEIEL